MVRGSNPGGGEIFRTCPERPWGPPSLLYNGYRVFPGGKERPGRAADPSPRSSAVVKKEYSYTSTPPVGLTAGTEPRCLYNGALYLLHRVKKEYTIQNKRRKCNWIGQILPRNCFLLHVIEGKIEGSIEVGGTRGRRREQLLEDFQGKGGHWKLKE